MGIVTVSEHRSLNESLLTTISGLRLRCSCPTAGSKSAQTTSPHRKATLQHLLANRRGKRVFYRTVDIRTLLIPFKELRKVGDAHFDARARWRFHQHLRAHRSEAGRTSTQGRPPFSTINGRPVALACLVSSLKRFLASVSGYRSLSNSIATPIRPPSQSKRNLARFYQNSLFLPKTAIQ